MQYVIYINSYNDYAICIIYEVFMHENEIKLYDWLKENQMTVKKLSEKIKCYRQIPQHIQNGQPVCFRIAMAIRILTNGRVNPAVKNAGRPRLINNSTD